MSGLERIILINCHLPGFVELDVSAHSNICGTNASGKTTLQRLIPVFFGELPSKVVPKTRKKFDEFYLPYSNSYLIYEYRSEADKTCQVVVTKKANEGVQYRFVAAPYDPEQLLVTVEEKGEQKAQAMNKEQWIRQLRQLQIDYSHLLSSTNEYRCVIQNDISAMGSRVNNKDALKLRQVAAQFSLVSSKHRIRHIEKLVTAVHSKEGKIDTLRSMLAAIFEEDGLVQPTTTVRNAKAKEWITQMRQTLRLQDLQTDYKQIEQLNQSLTATEEQLAQLRPLLHADKKRLTTQRADKQALRQQNNHLFNQAKTEFEQQESDINRKLSTTRESLNAKTARLTALEQQYDAYLAGDMDQLEKDSQALPELREQLEQSQQHYNLLIEQHQDLAAKLEQQKLKLAESLNRLVEKITSQTDELATEKDHLRHAQNNKAEQLRAEFEQQKDQLKAEYDNQLMSIEKALLTAKIQIENKQYNAEELERMQLAELRVEKAQQDWQHKQQKISTLEADYRNAQRQVEKADETLTLARKTSSEWREKVADIDSQLSPAQDSLRQFLNDNLNAWQDSVGKVIKPELLTRKDLVPKLAEGADSDNQQGSLFGLQLALESIDLPEFVQDEASLQERLSKAREQLSKAEQHKLDAEHALEQASSLQTQCSQALHQHKRLVEEAHAELSYASSAKQRLNEQLILARDERIKQIKQTLANAEKEKQHVQKTKTDALTRFQDEHREQLQEFKVGWQADLHALDDKISHLNEQISKKRKANKQQISELEEAFDLQLSEQNIDTNKLTALKQKNQQLGEKIQNIVSRSDELREYKTFISTEWQTVRPQLLDQESQLKRELEQQNQTLDSLIREFKHKRSAYNDGIKVLDADILQLGNTLNEISPLSEKLGNLHLGAEPSANAGQVDGGGKFGDQTERIMRASENIEARSRSYKKLNDLIVQFENTLCKDAGKDFLDIIQQSFMNLDDNQDCRHKLPILERLLNILAARQKQIVEQGETIGGDLTKFFTVFSDINRRIANQSKRLTNEVQDDLSLDGIAKSEVRIISTVDELNFWQPLKRFAKAFDDWQSEGTMLPSANYLEALADVVEVLPNQTNFSIESLLRLELHLNEGGSELVIRNDRQLLESSSHGMAYLILCKFLLAFTRLLRNQAKVHIHWPIDEIGTLAYHNVEKLFAACDNNHIRIVGAFPNPESDVLMLFKHRYLIDKQKQRLEKIQPKLSRISQRLSAVQAKEISA